jgi:LmbE family N-acetylglucosaminyl deacetylase
MSTILALATFGLEVVECGGALTLNVDHGGRSEAAVLLARAESRPQITRAGETLNTPVRYLDGTYGEVEASVEMKRRIVSVVREVRPDIVITQDPEHSFHDLDPDRRPAMILYLEALALAGRDWKIQECGGHAPHVVRTIYYMTPHHPNCVVDVAPVWDRKERALDALSGQLAFSGQMYRRMFGEALAAIAPDHAGLDDAALGRRMHREIDRAFHLYYGPPSHGRFMLAEPYRRDGAFQLDRLIV